MCYTTYNVCSWNEELGWEFLCWITSTNRDDLKSQVVENMKYFGVKKVLVYKLSDDEAQQGVIYQIRKSGKLCIYKNPEIVK